MIVTKGYGSGKLIVTQGYGASAAIEVLRRIFIVL